MVPVLDMISGVWLDGQHMKKREESYEFISDLSSLLVQIHELGLKYIVFAFPHINESLMHNVVDQLRKYPPKSHENFCETAITEFDTIEKNLSNNTFIHGDLHYGNIIIKDSKLEGFCDWDNKSVGDPHWELRMIRRWIGWDGLEKLISYYNSSTGENLNLDYIKILDKIALCNSYNLRLKIPRRDKPLSIIQEYIQCWPECWWQR